MRNIGDKVVFRPLRTFYQLLFLRKLLKLLAHFAVAVVQNIHDWLQLGIFCGKGEIEGGVFGELSDGIDDVFRLDVRKKQTNEKIQQ